MEHIDFPELVETGESCFNFCAIREANMPMLKKVNHRVFCECRKLSVINMPKVTEIGGQAF